MDKFRVDPKPVLIKKYHKEENATFVFFENCFIGNKMKKGDIWERYLHEVFETYLDSSSVVIDAGAFVGTHTVKLSKICKKVYAFEPCLPSFRLLTRNIKINRCDNVVLSSSGLSDTNGKTSFKWNRANNLGASALKGNDMEFFVAGKEDNATLNSVKLVSIDSLKLPKLDFIKIDVEGYETRVIKGAIKSIEKFMPLITCECYSKDGGTPSDELIEKKFKVLIDLGYRYERLEHHTDLLFLPK